MGFKRFTARLKLKRLGGLRTRRQDQDHDHHHDHGDNDQNKGNIKMRDITGTDRTGSNETVECGSTPSLLGITVEEDMIDDHDHDHGSLAEAEEGGSSNNDGGVGEDDARSFARKSTMSSSDSPVDVTLIKDGNISSSSGVDSFGFGDVADIVDMDGLSTTCDDDESATLLDESDSGDDGDYRRGVGRIRGRGLPEDSDESDSEDDGSDDLGDLPAGYLEFLSGGQNDVDDELSAITDRLHGRGKGGAGRASTAAGPFEINFVRESLFDEGAIRIARAMEGGCSSCSLTMSRNTFRSSPMPRSPPCQGPSKFLREIVLSRCQIGDKGACAIAHAISISCTVSLKTLDLSSNAITGVGTTCLANCIVTSSASEPASGSSTSTYCGGYGCKIETLVLSVNPIGSVGASALANALMGRRSECLSLQGSPDIITSRSHQGSNLIINNTTTGFCSLKNLHVSGCGLHDDDAIALGNAILPPDSPSETDLPLSPSLLSLPRTNNLMLLNIHGNQITTKGMGFLYSIIDNHHHHQPCRSTLTTEEQERSSGDDIEMISNNSSHLRSMQSLYQQTSQTSIWEIVT